MEGYILQTIIYNFIKVYYMFPRIGVTSVIFGFLIASLTEVGGADWRVYARSEFGSYYYDAENVNRFRKDFIRVWQKVVLGNRGTANLVNELGKEYENVYEAIILREIDCVDKKSRILELTFCSEEGRVIKKESYKPIGWDSILPDSVDDMLHQAVCK